MNRIKQIQLEKLSGYHQILVKVRRLEEQNYHLKKKISEYKKKQAELI